MVKSARRDPRAVDFGLYYLRRPGSKRPDIYATLEELERALLAAPATGRE
jgi:hypothetical protein